MRLIESIGEWLDARLQVGTSDPRDRWNILCRARLQAGSTFSAALPSLCSCFKS